MDNNATTKSDFWAERIRTFQESGLSRKDWCLENGISLSTFGYWFRKLQTADPKSDQCSDPVFARLPSEQEILSDLSTGYAPVTIRLPKDILIEVGANCPAGLVTAILRALKDHA